MSQQVESPWCARLRAYTQFPHLQAGESPLTSHEKTEINVLSDAAPLATDKLQRGAYRRGHAAAREELLLLLRGALEIIRHHAGELEHLGDDADLALVGQIEEVVR